MRFVLFQKLRSHILQQESNALQGSLPDFGFGVGEGGFEGDLDMLKVASSSFGDEETGYGGEGGFSDLIFIIFEVLAEGFSEALAVLPNGIPALFGDVVDEIAGTLLVM